MSAVMLIGWSVGLELLRRKDLYVMGLLVLVFSVGTLSARLVGIENGATGTFLLNLGLSLAYIFSHVLTLLLATRQLPSEIENRTIYPILARPVTRFQFLAGKWAACALSGFSAYLVFFVMIWFTNPHLESTSLGLMLQMLLLQGISLMLLSGLSILTSLIMPKGMAMLLVGGMVFGGAMIRGILESSLSSSSFATFFQWLIDYVPNFQNFNLTTRLTDGIGPLASTGFLLLLIYGVVHISFSLLISRWVFERRVL